MTGKMNIYTTANANPSHAYTQSSFDYKGLVPCKRFTTKPFPYQAETIEWMMAREVAPPADGICGGFVFHQMGLGKTLCALACTVLGGHQGRTLVVCPASLIQVWSAETHRHFLDVSVFLYYGSNRHEEYSKHVVNGSLPSIVVTAYTTVVSDIENADGLLRRETFHRLILDESHFIRNSKTKAFLAVERIPATVKWLLSGTPLPNSVTEMFPYLRLLGYHYVKNVQQLSKKAFTNRFMSRAGYLHLQSILKRVAIRRGKEVLALPERILRSIPLQMNGEERAFYMALKAYSRNRLKKLLRNLRRVSQGCLGRQLQARLRMINLQSVLSLIFHLRLACCDPQLVLAKVPRIQSQKNILSAARSLSTVSEDDMDCPVCYNDTATVVNVACNHLACQSCWDKLSSIEPLPICFSCMSPMSVTDLQPAARSHVIEEASSSDPARDSHVPSSKTHAIIQLVQDELQQGEKIIVVSQWTSYLDVLITEFGRRFPDVPYVVLTGKIPPAKRQRIIAQFQTGENNRVIFASLGSSAEGVTLTAAARMVIAEPYWNQAKIDQMSDRCHRIGQLKNVNVHAMYFEHSIEAKIMELVKKKAESVAVLLDCEKVNSATDGWLSKVVRLLED